MIIFPQINPYIFQIDIPILNFTLRPTWYGLMYVLAFASFYYLSLLRAKRFQWTEPEISDLLTYGMIGVIVGGRLGYFVFPYGWASLDGLSPFKALIQILKIWEGGMSFHGGLVGVLVACGLFARRTQRTFFQVTDFIAMSVPLGLFWGRLGNFINSELWGKPTDLPWGVVFPNGGNVARHPSQIYEALSEGLFTFIVIWIYSRKGRPIGKVSGLFLLGYGISRSLIEFVRIPDQQLGYYGFFTMGQMLSLPMILFGAYLFFYRKN